MHFDWKLRIIKSYNIIRLIFINSFNRGNIIELVSHAIQSNYIHVLLEDNKQSMLRRHLNMSSIMNSSQHDLMRDSSRLEDIDKIVQIILQY